MLVLPRDGEAVLLVPALEAPRVPDTAGMVIAAALGRDRGPGGAGRRPPRPGGGRHLRDLGPGLGAVAAGAAGAPARGAVRGGLDGHVPAAGREGRRARSRPCGPRRRPPTAWPRCSRTGEIPLAGRSEAQVSEALGTGLLAAGHRRVNFAIVGSGPNGASPHHEAGERVIEPGDTVVCDFGGEYVLARRRRLLLRHHPDRGGGRARRRGARHLRRAPGRAAGRGGRGAARGHRRARRRRGPRA